MTPSCPRLLCPVSSEARGDRARERCLACLHHRVATFADDLLPGSLPPLRRPHALRLRRPILATVSSERSHTCASQRSVYPAALLPPPALPWRWANAGSKRSGVHSIHAAVEGASPPTRPPTPHPQHSEARTRPAHTGRARRSGVCNPTARVLASLAGRRTSPKSVGVTRPRRLRAHLASTLPQGPPPFLTWMGCRAGMAACGWAGCFGHRSPLRAGWCSVAAS